MKNGWVAYVGQMLFPWGQAASRRVYGIARSLVDAGYDVRVASGSSEPKAITGIDCLPGSGTLSHIGLGIYPSRKETQARKAVRIFFDASRQVIRWMDQQSTKPTHVILYGGYASYLARLLPWCRRNRVALIGDVVEWYKSSELPGGVFGLHSMNVNYAMRILYPKCDGIIAISSYLAQHYRDRGCEVIRIPPTIDVREIQTTRTLEKLEGNSLTLVYAGVAGNKDLLGNVIRAMLQVDPNCCRVRLLILGYDTDQVRSQWMDGNPLPASILALGKVAQDKVASILRTADFSVIIRPEERFSRAGFPTKFVESLANGVPVIGNHTSDMAVYLTDGVEGIVCADETTAAFTDGLKRALLMTAQERASMRLAARRQAERSFDYRCYSRQLESFMSSTGKAG